MAMLTVRNLPDDVHRALRVLAAQHGRSTEAEVRDILAVAVKPEPDGYIVAIAVSRGFIVASRDTAPYEAANVTVINPWNM